MGVIFSLLACRFSSKRGFQDARRLGVYLGLNYDWPCNATSSSSAQFSRSFRRRHRRLRRACLEKPASAEMLAVFEPGCVSDVSRVRPADCRGGNRRRPAARLLLVSGWSFVAGILTIFSGSLYALALTGTTTFGAITPIGGLGILIGWACLALFAAVEGFSGPRCEGQDLRMMARLFRMTLSRQRRAEMSGNHDLVALVVLLALAGGPAAARRRCPGQKWAATWAASVHGPYPSGNPSAQPDLTFAFPIPRRVPSTSRSDSSSNQISGAIASESGSRMYSARNR